MVLVVVCITGIVLCLMYEAGHIAYSCRFEMHHFLVFLAGTSAVVLLLQTLISVSGV